MIFAALLAVAGCEAFYEPHAVGDAKATARDAAWCQEIGVEKADARYPDCMIVARQLRLDERTVTAAQAQAMIGAGVYTLPRNDTLTIQNR